MADSRRFVELSVRIYQSLMHVYPASFRRQYGCEMTRVFREVATDSTERHGSAGLITTWSRVLGDLALSAFHEHLLELQGRFVMKTETGWLAKLLAILSVLCFWIVPCSPVLAIAAVSTTKGSSGWPRKVAVAGAILCTVWTLVFAALLLWLLFIRNIRGSWAF
jgi:hypothetical protein